MMMLRLSKLEDGVLQFNKAGGAKVS